MKLRVQSIEFKDACDWVDERHRHHKKPQGWKFGCACTDGEKIVGVVMVGYTVAKTYDRATTLEVRRLCTDGTKNACSFLYAAACRLAKAAGYQRLITYTLDTESGVSLIASGWQLVGKRRAGSWSVPSRRRIDKHPTQPKLLWEKIL